MSEYKFTPIIIEKDKDGKLVLDEEKLKELLKEAYNNGWNDGWTSGNAAKTTTTPTTSPYNPMPYQPDIVPTTPTIPISPYYPPTSPFWYEKWYVTTSSD